MLCFRIEKNVSAFCSLLKSLCCEPAKFCGDETIQNLDYFLGQIDTTGRNTSACWSCIALKNSGMTWKGRQSVLKIRASQEPLLWPAKLLLFHVLQQEMSPPQGERVTWHWTLHEPSIQNEIKMRTFFFFLIAPWLGGQTRLYSEAKFGNVWLVFIFHISSGKVRCVYLSCSNYIWKFSTT